MTHIHDGETKIRWILPWVFVRFDNQWAPNLPIQQENCYSQVTALLEVGEVASADSLFILPAEIEQALDSIKKKEEAVITFKICSQFF